MMKRIAIIALSALSAAAMLSGCGGNDSSIADDTAVSQAAQEQSAADSPVLTAAIVNDVDFMAYYTGGEGVNYIGMTLDELNQNTSSNFDTAKAAEVDDFSQKNTYHLGEIDSLFGGKAKLPSKLPVDLMISFSDEGKINKITYSIEQGSADAKAVSDAVAAYFKDNLPKEYKAEYDRKNLGKDSACFFNSADDYVFTVNHMDIDDSGYPVRVIIESYKDKYGM